MGQPANSATQPMSACEGLAFDWNERHEAAKAAIRQSPVDLVFIGDSITHVFGGQPTSPLAVAPDVWERYYGARHAVNLGFGWDRTQQALWRLQNGEFEGIHPKVAVVMIGTNNLTPHAARGNTNAEIVAGVKAICATLHDRSPRTEILLLGIFPRGQQPKELNRVRILQINQELARLQGRNNITFLDIGTQFLAADGVMLPDVTTGDFLHPNAKGYDLWAAAMEPTLARLLGERAK